jgi:hypothetical protein
MAPRLTPYVRDDAALGGYALHACIEVLGAQHLHADAGRVRRLHPPRTAEPRIRCESRVRPQLVTPELPPTSLSCLDAGQYRRLSRRWPLMPPRLNAHVQRVARGKHEHLIDSWQDAELRRLDLADDSRSDCAKRVGKVYDFGSLNECRSSL